MQNLRNHRFILWLLLLLVVVCAGCQARYDRFMASGMKMMKTKDYARAIIQFQNAIVARPKDGKAYYELGLAFLGAGDIRRGYAVLKQAVDLDPSNNAAQLKIAQLQSSTGDPDMLKDAEKRLQALLSGSGRDPDTLNTLAATEMRLGDLRGASQHLEELLAASPQQLISSVLLANTKLAQRDVKGAEEVLKRACANDPKSPDAAIMLGKFYISMNHLPEAEQQFQRALQLDAKNAAALSSLALVQYFGGRKQQAEQSFKRLSTFPDTQYNFMYGLFLFQENRAPEAAREFERLAKKYPSDRDARTRLIAAYFQMGRTTDAEGALAGVLKKNPRDVSALLQRGELYMTTRKYAQAEIDLNQVIHLTPDSPEAHYLLAKLNKARGSTLIYRQELSEALRLNPGLLTVRLELAQVLLQDKGAQSALEVLNDVPAQQRDLTVVLVARNWAFWALGDMPSMRKGIDEGLAKEKSSELLIQDGLWKLKAGKPLDARTSLDEALKINPSDIRALQVLTQTYVAQKNTAAAIGKVKEYAALQPQSAPVQEFLGVMLMANGDKTGAQKAFAAAKAADPRFIQADMSLVQLYTAEGQLPEARKVLEGLVLQDQGKDNTTARLWLGNVQEMMSDHRNAIAQFRDVVQANPNDGQALNNLAYLLAEQGSQLDEALKYAQRAVELAPDKPDYADTLGWILYRKGLYSSAIRYFEQASAHPGSVVWKYHLAMAYAKGGDLRRGRNTLQAALKINAKVPEAKVAEQVVGSPERVSQTF